MTRKVFTLQGCIPSQPRHLLKEGKTNGKESAALESHHWGLRRHEEELGLLLPVNGGNLSFGLTWLSGPTFLLGETHSV